MQRIIDKINELFDNETVDRVLGWKVGEFSYDRTPAVFTKEGGLEGFAYDSFCANNLSKYLINESRNGGKVLVLLKPCDTYSYNQLIAEHRIKTENVYTVSIPCKGKIDVEKIKAMGITGITDIKEDGEKLTVETLYGTNELDRKEVLCEKCLACKKTAKECDEAIEGEAYEKPAYDRFEMVEKLEAMTPEERFAFWRKELSKCIRCNACRNVCPACSCIKCVFDNDASGIASKANTDEFQENMFHIIRAFHVAGRCTDCGECSRVCPQGIPLHLLNRKFIKEINELYGEYQAGDDTESRGPLTNFTKEDCEPSIVYEKGR